MGSASDDAVHATGTIFRLRDLDARSRAVAGLLALALVLAPVFAVAHFLPDWSPTSDNAFIALRALDVGTSRTPMTGQPSFSAYYAGNEEVHVDHLGALEFYALAPFVRALGVSAGMLTFAAAVSGAAALLSTWVVFRLLGPRAAVAAAVVVALVLYTRGAGALVNPLSSVFSGFPLFCAAVLVWALLSGDDRLLPLTAGVVSFGIQMHLAVGLVTSVLVVAALVGMAAHWWSSGLRDDPEVRRRAVRLSLATAAVSVVLWLPVIAQQLFGEYPNLSALVEFGTDTDRASQGSAVAVRQLAHVLALPPLLGRRDFQPFSSLFAPPDWRTWLSALAVLVTLAAVGAMWWRRSRVAGEGEGTGTGDPAEATAARRRSLLVVMVAVLIAASYVNTSNIPVSNEAFRGEFYHWVWPLTFFVTLALALAAGEGIGALAARARAAGVSMPAGLGVVPVAAAVLVVAALGVAGTAIDRDANSLQAVQSELPREVYESLADQVVEERGDLQGPVLLDVQGQLDIGLHQSGLAAQLEAAGLPVVLPTDNINYVADQRLADPDTVGSALVLTVETLAWHPGAALDAPGREIARYDVRMRAADVYDDLVAEVEDADHVVFGDELRARTAATPVEEGRLTEAYLQENAPEVLRHTPTLALLQESPLAEPALDPDELAYLETALDDAGKDAPVGSFTAVQLRVFEVTGPELDEMLGRTG